jgi:hypothetical protein
LFSGPSEAGILGGKLYLSPHAQRLEATGLTFFDCHAGCHLKR